MKWWSAKIQGKNSDVCRDLLSSEILAKLLECEDVIEMHLIDASIKNESAFKKMEVHDLFNFTIEEAERVMLANALVSSDTDAEAAKSLGISPRALLYKKRKHGILSGREKERD